ncbi:MAG: NAD(+) synthase [Muribaculaceae bacterium]|nr:NAD(+) synthase [Muribaculaceae bacterium]
MAQEFFRVAAASPVINVGDCEYNTNQILKLADELVARGVEMAVFPEMCITGYTCADLHHTGTLIDATLRCIHTIMNHAATRHMVLWVGASLPYRNALYNCAIAIGGGKLLAVVPKTYLPTYNEFYEKRWWTSGHNVSGTINLGPAIGEVPIGTGNLVATPGGILIGAEVCEDLWAPIPPSTYAALAGAHIIVNLSASNDVTGKYDYLLNLIKSQSTRCIGAYVYSSAGYGESTTDLVFDSKCIIAENGSIIEKSPRWSLESQYAIADIDISAINRDRLHNNTFNDCASFNRPHTPYNIINVDCTPAVHDDDIMHPYSATPFLPEGIDVDAEAAEIINIQTHGLARRLDATRCRTAVIGISGGLDSTLALLITANAFDLLGLDRSGIIGVTMPGFGTTGRTHNNAVTLMQALGVTMREISIVSAVNQHFADIGHDPAVRDVTYENAQARQRTYLLMDIANQTGGMVIGTGDLSELALGWATYNGDHMSMYGVNAGIPKTMIRHLVEWFAHHATDPAEKTALLDIVDTPISPELIPADNDGNITQKTEDLVGPYELHDFFLYHLLRYGRSTPEIYRLALHVFDGRYTPETIQHWLTTFMRRFFNQQFKRSCMPDGPKVTGVGLSPRGDWRMPSDASGSEWKP